jgi:gluconokinase
VARHIVQVMTDLAAESGAPDVIVVMGVSGSGKSTVAKGIATTMGWEFAEGDEFHPKGNVEKMARGEPLTDEDRWPWLRLVGDWISERVSRGQSAVVACSALRRAYRDILREGRPQVRFCHILADPEVIEDRMEQREGHYMPASLLPSQLATLEDLEEDEPGVEVPNEGSAAEVLGRALRALGLVQEESASGPTTS